LPTGFEVESTHKELITGSEHALTHIVYSDGMASVSVFISEVLEDEIRQSAQRGTSNSFSTAVDGYQITAVGEVPPQTVEMIATSMRQR
jgi:sigma-E factor negative regulatory protein RseB